MKTIKKYWTDGEVKDIYNLTEYEEEHKGFDGDGVCVVRWCLADYWNYRSPLCSSGSSSVFRVLWQDMMTQKEEVKYYDCEAREVIDFFANEIRKPEENTNEHS